jgi:hypothetical protein
MSLNLIDITIGILTSPSTIGVSADMDNHPGKWISRDVFFSTLKHLPEQSCLRNSLTLFWTKWGSIPMPSDPQSEMQRTAPQAPAKYYYASDGSAVYLIICKDSILRIASLPYLHTGERKHLLSSDPRPHPGQPLQRHPQHLVLLHGLHLVPPVAHEQGGGGVEPVLTPLNSMTEQVTQLKKTRKRHSAMMSKVG